MSNSARLVFSADSKTVTILGVNGSSATVVAQHTLGFWARKDGGFTFSVDGEHNSQTIRADRYGRLTTKNAQGKQVPLATVTRLRSA